MSANESQPKSFFGDGKSVSLYDPEKPFTHLVYDFAKSNGCPGPDHYQQEIAALHPEIKDYEEIARLASTVYARQNFVFRKMVESARKYENKKLYVDMTKVMHRHGKIEHLEPENVPNWFLVGLAQGLSRDPGFFIAEKIASTLGDSTPTKSGLKKYFRLINILEKQIVVSEDLDQLHAKFFAAVKKSKL